MAALDYTAMASELMSKGWAGSGRDPGRLMSQGWGGQPDDQRPTQNQRPTQSPAPQSSGGDPFGGIVSPPPTQPPAPQTQPALAPGGMGLDPFAGLINTTTAVGPSTAPGVPVLPQEGGSMSDMFGQVMSALRPSSSIDGTGKPAPGAPVAQQPTNNFDAQLIRGV